MREATKRRLHYVLWLERLKWAAGGLVIAGLAAAGLWLTGLDASVERKTIGGVVQAVGPLNGTNSLQVERGLAVDVKLDDGRVAHVQALKASNPQVGAHVEIVEHVHGTGRVTFTWK